MKHLGGKGFTVVETLIVLAVTSAMFIVAVLAFSGQQERTRFSQATRDAESKLMDIANDVSAGYFPESDTYTCTKDAVSGGPELTENAGGQGTNEACIFVGKAVQFGNNQNCADAPCEDIRIVTVVGNRQAANGVGEQVEVTSLAEAKPIAAPAGSSFIEDYLFQYGLGATKILDDSNTEINGLAFLSSLSPVQSGEDLVTGSQATRLYAINTEDGQLGMSDEAFDESVALIEDADRIRTATICMANGPNGRPAAIILTDQGGGVSSELLVDGQAGVCNA